MIHTPCSSPTVNTNIPHKQLQHSGLQLYGTGWDVAKVFHISDAPYNHGHTKRYTIQFNTIQYNTFLVIPVSAITGHHDSLNVPMMFFATCPNFF